MLATLLAAMHTPVCVCVCVRALADGYRWNGLAAKKDEILFSFVPHSQPQQQHQPVGNQRRSESSPRLGVGIPAGPLPVYRFIGRFHVPIVSGL